MKRTLFFFSMFSGMLLQACSTHHPNDHIKNIRVVREGGNTGEVMNAVVEYQRAIKNNQLDTNDFKVSGRRVIHVYANTSGKPDGGGTDGRFVIVELDNSGNVQTTSPKDVHQVGNLETVDGRRFEANDHSIPSTHQL